MKPRIALVPLAALLILAGCQSDQTAAPAPAARPPLAYAIGADLSFLRQAEARGTLFKDQGVAKPGLRIFRDHGYDWIRLRLFNSPDRLPNDLAYTIALAREARQLGFKFLLDFHFSDTWADPAKQFLPKAWEGKSHAELVTLMHDYTRDTIRAFREAGVMPDMVQPGNEVIAGMMWPDGKLPGNWDNFAALVRSALAGVEAGRGDAPRPLIMIHLDRGGDLPGTRAFFDRFNSYGIAYDVIGQSYYPWWHGSILDLRANLAFMAETYRKDIIIVEAAYNWRTAEYKDGGAPFPETPEGQREFLEEVHRAVLATPHGLGKGVFWWEPAVAPAARGISSRGMFDPEGNALPVISVFDRFTRGKPPKARP